MKFSFITIAYNEEKYLPALLADLKNQQYPHSDIQVILVDSASTDKTKEIMTEFAKRSDFAQCLVLDNPKRVLAAGWNIALSHAFGDIIVKIDGHGRIGSDFLINVCKEMDTGEDIVGGQRITVFEGESDLSKILAHAECSVFGSGVASYRRKTERKYVKTLAHAAYRKKVFDTVGGFNEVLRRTEDNEIHLRMREAGFKFCQCPNICTYLHARSSFPAMVKQKKGNGYWIGITFPKYPKCMSLYNFVPFIFVLALAVTVIIGAVCGSFFNTVALLAAYFIGAAGATLVEMKKEKSKRIRFKMIILPAVFFIMHFVYGAYTAVGLAVSPFIDAHGGKK